MEPLFKLNLRFGYSDYPHQPSQVLKKRPKVLLLGRISAEDHVLAELKAIAEVHNLPPQSLEEAKESIQRIAKDGPFEAVAAMFSRDPFPWRYGPDLMGALKPYPKLFVSPGAGYDTVNVDWLTEIGAYFANCPLEVGRRTADATLSLLLTITRGLSTQFLSARAGNWRDPKARAIDWRGATLGIIGLGNIGSQVATMAQYMGFKVVYSNRHKSEEEDFEFVSREELYKRADVVLLLTPLTDETRGMINKDSIAQMKDEVIIVNVSRGPVVNEQHLVDALESGKVLRAALDVFENEPEIHPKLRENNNVYLTPHVAAVTEDIVVKGANESVRNVIHYLRTGKPTTPVNDPKHKSS